VETLPFQCDLHRGYLGHAVTNCFLLPKLTKRQMINPTQEIKTILLGETMAQINSTGPAGPDQPTPGSPIGGAFNTPKCQSIFHSGTKSVAASEKATFAQGQAKSNQHAQLRISS
jgi:hypothetical protein